MIKFPSFTTREEILTSQGSSTLRGQNLFSKDPVRAEVGTKSLQTYRLQHERVGMTILSQKTNLK